MAPRKRPIHRCHSQPRLLTPTPPITRIITDPRPCHVALSPTQRPLLSENKRSKIVVSCSNNACWIGRSTTLGMPSRCAPPLVSFEAHTCGRYSPASNRALRTGQRLQDTNQAAPGWLHQRATRHAWRTHKKPAGRRNAVHLSGAALRSTGNRFFEIFTALGLEGLGR